MIVVDNFLPFFDQILERSTQFPYFTCDEENKRDGTTYSWRGQRTPDVIDDMPVLRQYMEETLCIKLDVFSFHKHEPLPDFMPVLHQDGDYKSAGVIYLKGGPGCGTIVDNTVVDFKENRLVTYDGQLLHRPQGFMTDRLILTFFSHESLPDHLNGWFTRENPAPQA
ncbi:hypothetical protein [Halocynthiibacter namhaensis]|uniref:hypothetical protein n=1 Tax=Halocynthiibacter namhaensis TaxID=1290553 RepID=UPI00057969FC|nr:hypothetical protein [Halocynthiibacter namhaensis]